MQAAAPNRSTLGAAAPSTPSQTSGISSPSRGRAKTAERRKQPRFRTVASAARRRNPAATHTFKKNGRSATVHAEATLSRFRTAVTAVGGYDETQLRGFEIAFVPKSKFLSKNKNPRLLGRFLSRVDGPAVAETWSDAGKWTSDEVCVLLLGSSLAPARELATAIAEQRKKSRSKVTLIPVDARDWAAHIPTDAPDVAKESPRALKAGT
jgi:hypothetical protein